MTVYLIRPIGCDITKSGNTLVKPLAIRLGQQKTLTKSLVIRSELPGVSTSRPYESAFMTSSTTFLASPNTIMVLSR